MRRLQLGVVVLGVSLLAIGCASGNPSAPSASSTTPSTLTLTAVAGHGANAGHATLTAGVQNASGAPVAGVAVLFLTSVGTVSPGSVVTAANGTATTVLTANGATANLTAVAGSLNASASVVTDALTAPTLTSLTPASGGTGTMVTITGANFGATAGTSTVTFNGSASTPASWTGTSIVVPSLSATGPVVVTVGGVASNGLGFTMTAPPSGPSPAPAPSSPGASTLVISLAAVATTANAQTLLQAVVVGSAQINQFAWAFGDGATVITAGASATHAYTTAGTYTASVTVTDSLSRTASASGQVTVAAAAPPTPPTPPTPPAPSTLTISLAAVATTVNTPALLQPVITGTVQITQYAWTFGDGTTFVSTTGSSATHSYPAAGTYTVTVTITDALGHTATATGAAGGAALAATLYCEAGTAAGATPPVPSNCNVVVTYAGVVLASGLINQVVFDWGTGTPTVVVPPAPPEASYQYPLAGTYMAFATVKATPVSTQLTIISSTATVVIPLP
jgi:hypothetical protein